MRRCMPRKELKNEKSFNLVYIITDNYEQSVTAFQEVE